MLRQHIARQHIACISATCIPLYPATDGQQTGNNFVDGNKQHVAGNMLLWCKRSFRFTYSFYHYYSFRHFFIIYYCLFYLIFVRLQSVNLSIKLSMTMHDCTVCDVRCTSGCSVRGEGKCDSSCSSGHSLNSTKFVCSPGGLTYSQRRTQEKNEAGR